MSYELLYTSVPRGLTPGSRGFCVVAATEGMPPRLQQLLEALSGYRHIHSPGDPRNRPIHSLVTLECNGVVYSVLSQVVDAGIDYSKRSNKLAHHIALTAAERNQYSVASLLKDPQLFRSSWNDTPRYLPPRALPAGGSVQSAIAHTWKELAGDPGWGGALAATVHLPSRERRYVLVPDGANPLQLAWEALALLDPRKQWEATFTTFPGNLPPTVECRWRFLPASSQEAQAVRRQFPAQTIDLSRPLGPPAPGRLTDLARGHITKEDVSRTPLRSSSLSLDSRPSTPPPVSNPPTFDSVPAKPPVPPTEPTPPPNKPTPAPNISTPNDAPPPSPNTAHDVPVLQPLCRPSSRRPIRLIWIAPAALILLMAIGVIGVMTWNSKSRGTATASRDEQGAASPRKQQDRPPTSENKNTGQRKRESLENHSNVEQNNESANDMSDLVTAPSLPENDSSEGNEDLQKYQENSENNDSELRKADENEKNDENSGEEGDAKNGTPGSSDGNASRQKSGNASSGAHPATRGNGNTTKGPTLSSVDVPTEGNEGQDQPAPSNEAQPPTTLPIFVYRPDFGSVPTPAKISVKCPFQPKSLTLHPAKELKASQKQEESSWTITERESRHTDNGSHHEVASVVWSSDELIISLLDKQKKKKILNIVLVASSNASEQHALVVALFDKSNQHSVTPHHILTGQYDIKPSVRVAEILLCKPSDSPAPEKKFQWEDAKGRWKPTLSVQRPGETVSGHKTRWEWILKETATDFNSTTFRTCFGDGESLKQFRSALKNLEQVIEKLKKASLPERHDMIGDLRHAVETTPYMTPPEWKSAIEKYDELQSRQKEKKPPEKENELDEAIGTVVDAAEKLLDRWKKVDELLKYLENDKDTKIALFGRLEDARRKGVIIPLLRKER